MLHITIIAVGKLHEPWKSLAAEYKKRLGLFAKVDIKECAEVSFSQKSDRKRVIKAEGESLSRLIPKSSTVLALTEHGKQETTETFAALLKKWNDAGESIVFVIGGALGISDEIVKNAHRTLSLSPLTFTHQMTRVILLEQLYRGMSIVRGKIYHY